MATISAQEFFGGTIPPPPADTTIHTPDGPQPGILSSRIGAMVNQSTPGYEGAGGAARGILHNAGQVAGAVTDVIGTGVHAVDSAIGSPLEKTAAAVAQTPIVQDAAASYSAWKAQHPQAADALESTVNIASILPVGAASGVAAKTAATGAGTGIKALGTATEVVGRATKGTAKALYETGFNKTAAEAERQLAYEANAPLLTRTANVLKGAETPGRPRPASDTAFEKGIVGTEKMVGVQSKRAADTLWKEKIAPAVKSSDAVITQDQLFAPAEKIVAQTTDPTRKNALQTALDSLKEDYRGHDVWSLDTAQALKRDLDTFTPKKIFRGQDVASEMRTLQHAMADGIRQHTYKSLSDVNIKKDYLDWANLHQLEQVGVKAISEAKLKGGFGGFWSGMWDMATTPLKTVGGQVLYRVGNTVEFVGEKGIKRFGDFLKTRGFNKPSSSKPL